MERWNFGKIGYYRNWPISKESGPRGTGFVSPHRGVINISLQVVGKLEYWNTGMLGRKSECCSIWEYQNAHVSYEVGGSP